MGRLNASYKRLGLLGLNTMVVLACLLFLQQVWTPAAIGLVVVVVLALGWLARSAPADRFAATRVLAIVALAIQAWEVAGRAAGPSLALAAGLLALLVLMDSTIRQSAGRPLWAVNLPGFQMPRTTMTVGGPVYVLTIVLTLLLAAVAAGWLPPVVMAVIASASALVTLTAVGLDSSRRPAEDVTAAIQERLVEYAPEFMVYFSAPPGSEYQVNMWLPYLDRLGKRYVILTRETPMFRTLRGTVAVPLLRASSLAATEAALVDSLTTLFYVNNGAKNVHTVRFQHLTHVQLLHGDSDKPPSYSPVTAMYDKVFVAGQAGIDRYATHGVLIPREKFVVVGRPQVEAIEVSRSPAKPVAPRIVLYAPTWAGQFTDTSLSSLPIADRIVGSLLALGEIVWFRPHPYSYRDPVSAAQIAAVDRQLAEAVKQSGLAHQWGDAVGSDRPLFECLNASDALVTDVSSVAADYLFSRKPFAVSDVGLGGDDAEQVFPLIRAAYLLPQSGDPTPVLGRMLGEDPLSATRDELRAYYLGGFPEDRYADVFVEESRRIIEHPTVRPRSDDPMESETGDGGDDD